MSDVTDSEKDALMAWLDRVELDYGSRNGERARALKRMLARPRLPEPATIETEMLSAMMRAYNGAPDGDWVKKWFAAYRALYEILTKPRTKTVEVWRIEAAIGGSDGWIPACSAYRTEEEAARRALDLTAAGWRAVRVTGPHKQEVPA